MLFNVWSFSVFDLLVGFWRKECIVVLVFNFIVNNRSNKGVMGNCVIIMVYNYYIFLERVFLFKSFN